MRELFSSAKSINTGYQIRNCSVDLQQPNEMDLPGAAAAVEAEQRRTTLEQQQQQQWKQQIWAIV